MTHVKPLHRNRATSLEKACVFRVVLVASKMTFIAKHAINRFSKMFFYNKHTESIKIVRPFK